ncbi:hypothetical protein CL645_06320 [bacterium]|nr:hypothetical protein [bacterium]
MVKEQVKKAIFIAGFMGTGKTTVGKEVARHLGRKFIDTDSAICEESNCENVQDFFSKFGESLFRKKESEIISKLADSGNVISLGGGSDQNSEIKDILTSQHLVRLLAPMSEIEKRIKEGSVRPLWEMREELYRKREGKRSLGLKIDTSNKQVGEVVSLVLRTLNAGVETINKKHNITFGWGSSNYSIDESNAVGVIEDNVSGYLFAFPKGCNEILNFAGGENSKTYENIHSLLDFFNQAGLSRDGSVVVMGGGAISDIVGFAASIHLRGVSIHLVPTTLLSMVDASIGGKFAVNFADAKNLVGNFHMPKSIRLDSSFLPTLKYREYLSGLAEMIKMSCLDKALFSAIYKDVKCLKDQNLIKLNSYIKKVVNLKCKYVDADPYDTHNQRIFLNFGHTVGHAIELSSSKKIRHGEAVGLGMIAMSKWSEMEGLSKAGTAEVIQDMLAAAGLPTNVESFNVDKTSFLEALQKDKKWTSQGLNVVYPKAIGDFEISNLTNPPAEKWLDLIS